jgi:hypothetical protein
MILTNKEGFVIKTLDTEYDYPLFQVNERCWFSLSESTHVWEIEGYGTTAQKKLAEGTGRGLMWRLFSIARYEQRDGGVYVEIEAMALSRDIPVSLRWVVVPVVRRISQNSLIASLRQTENAVRTRGTVTTVTLEKGSGQRRQIGPTKSTAPQSLPMNAPVGAHAAFRLSQ